MKVLKFYLVFIIVYQFWGCRDSQNSTEKEKEVSNEYKEKINRLEAEMFKSKELNSKIAVNAVKAYSDYASAFKSDSLSPFYLFKAAEIASALKHYQEACAYYENIENNYPDFKEIETTYFLHASLYDYSINDDKKAESLYKELIKKYPTSIYANDTKAAIANLGKSLDELVKEFEKKNK